MKTAMRVINLAARRRELLSGSNLEQVEAGIHELRALYLQVLDDPKFHGLPPFPEIPAGTLFHAISGFMDAFVKWRIEIPPSILGAIEATAVCQ